MLKKRVTGVIVVRGGLAVQSLGFARYLPVGRPELVAEALDRYAIDEIVLLDIEATAAGRGPDLDLVRRVSAASFVPLAVGGGVRTLEQAVAVVHSGADKVVVNAAFLDDPGLVRRLAGAFGNQCVVVSLDARGSAAAGWRVHGASASRDAGCDPVAAALRAEDAGAGEILLTAADRDGAKGGYDLDLVRAVASRVRIPVIACGGAGHPEHFRLALTEGLASAAAAANFFHFTEHSATCVKAYLARAGVPVRLDSYADYGDAGFDPAGRPDRRTDGHLEEIRFVHFPRETV